MYQLFIGNKNYSTWSMRPWILLKQAGIPFQEHLIQFDGLEPNSQFKIEISKLNPTGKVPILVDDDLIGIVLPFVNILPSKAQKKTCCRRIKNYVPEHVVSVQKCTAAFKLYGICVQ